MTFLKLMAATPLRQLHVTLSLTQFLPQTMPRAHSENIKCTSNGVSCLGMSVISCFGRRQRPIGRYADSLATTVFIRRQLPPTAIKMSGVRNTSQGTGSGRSYCPSYGTVNLLISTVCITVSSRRSYFRTN